MMWFLLLLLYIAHIVPVDLQGPDRLVLRNGKHPCEGHLEIHHGNTWGYVGDTNWNENTEKVVCNSINCGTCVLSKDMIRPKDKPVWLDEMKCGGSEDQLWNCKNPGFGATTYQQDQTKWIKCSDNIQISLEGFKCAGAVKYTSGTSEGYFCGDTWGKDEADLLCKSLGCGISKEIPKRDWRDRPQFNEPNLPKMVVSCSDVEGLDNLWQCAPQPKPTCSKPAVVICKDHQSLQIKGEQSNACHGELEKEEGGEWKQYTPKDINASVLCNKMHCGTSGSYTADSGTLECSDRVSVTLMDKGQPSKCYGEVHITVNDVSSPVCATDWSKEDAEVVCRELKCGKVIPSVKSVDSQTNGIMDNVQCSGSESSLWHCRAERTRKWCSAVAFVVCAESIAVRLEDSPGTCAGRVEIEYGGQWQRATKEGWTENNSESVCQSLDCGAHRSGSPEKFSQGSAKFLDKTVNCPSDNSPISDCIEEKRASPREAVTITCEEHKMVFLDDQCRGKVGIEKDADIFWLSGHNTTWNKESADAVCRQMHCGEASTYASNPRDEKSEQIWRESYNCSPNAKSLFDCDEGEHNQSDTIATVTCSGNITVSLTKACWGNVNVCVGGKCGGVCNDTWTKEKSKMLCENLNCGNKVLDGLSTPGDYELTVKSLHTAKNILNMNQSNIVGYEEKDYTCKPAYVVCSGSVKARINTTISKCSGNLELEYEGRWLPVCKEALDNKEIQNIFCEQQQCGQSASVLDLGPKEAGARAISTIQCPGKKSLEECEVTASDKVCTLVGLRCSSWRKVEVKFGGACSGHVYVYSEGKKSAVSFEGWNTTEGQTLCRDLKCGKYISGQGEITGGPFWSGTFSCANSSKPENIWDCENPALPSTKQQQQLNIRCEGEPSVTLSDNCSGEVKINNVSVCKDNDKAWNMDYSNLVCKELNCSNAHYFYTKKTNQDVREYQHVRCEDYHGKLGQCNRFKGKCNGGLVTVDCVKSVNFTIDKCGGEIKVRYQDRLEKVCLVEFPTHLKEELCQSFRCGSHNANKQPTSSKEEKLNLILNCTKDYNSIQHCVKHSERTCKPAEIYCTGFVPPPTPTPKPKPIPMVPTILGVGLTLIVVILIVVFVRIFIVRRAKRSMYASSRTFEGEEVEFESGDYEDVTGKENEMEALSQGKFGPNADIIMESDGRSNTSLPYDDIDEAAEAKLQISPAATATASGDKFFREGALEQSSDGVTYEVDDPQENYDDIEAGPETSQIKAEVHDSPQTTPESVAVAPSGVVRGTRTTWCRAKMGEPRLG